MKIVLEAFDKYLEDKDMSFFSTVIGATALIVMGIIDRATRDVDCLAPPIPPEVKTASKIFAASYRGVTPLDEAWLNNGPDSLARDLPAGWQDRTVPLFTGKRMTLRTLGRLDLLRSKLFAYCDRQQDLEDCLAMQPTLAELSECLEWLTERDLNPLWPKHVHSSLRLLAERLGYGHDKF